MKRRVYIKLIILCFMPFSFYTVSNAQGLDDNWIVREFISRCYNSMPSLGRVRDAAIASKLLSVKDDPDLGNILGIGGQFSVDGAWLMNGSGNILITKSGRSSDNNRFAESCAITSLFFSKEADTLADEVRSQLSLGAWDIQRGIGITSWYAIAPKFDHRTVITVSQLSNGKDRVTSIVAMVNSDRN